VRHSAFCISFLLLALALFTACKSGKPSGVLSPSAMEDVLYDYHLARALAQQCANDSVYYYMELYQQAALKKHNVDKAQFDSSMVWYTRHTKELQKIYERLSERFGGSASDASAGNLKAKTFGTTGDTLNLWKGASSVILSSHGRENLCFQQKVDTTLREGDRLQWTFNAQWHYHEGMRQAYALLIVRYEGDSVAVASQSVFASGDQMVSITIGKRRVKQIEGFIYQSTERTERPRLLSLAHFALYRMRTGTVKSPANEEAGNGGDSVGHSAPVNPRNRLRDSLLRLDTLNERRNHFR